MSHQLVVDAAESTVAILEGPIPVAGARTPWGDRLTPEIDARSYQVNLRETITSIPEILEALDRDSMQRALVQQLATRVASPRTWLQYLQDLGRQFDLLVNRAARQRNAVIHGADTVARWSTPSVTSSTG